MARQPPAGSLDPHMRKLYFLTAFVV